MVSRCRENIQWSPRYGKTSCVLEILGSNGGGGVGGGGGGGPVARSRLEASDGCFRKRVRPLRGNRA